jgi:hypothetical protein
MLFQLGQATALYASSHAISISRATLNGYHISKTAVPVAYLLVLVFHCATLCGFLYYLKVWLSTNLKIGPLVALEAHLLIVLVYGLFMLMSPAPFTAAT